MQLRPLCEGRLGRSSAIEMTIDGERGRDALDIEFRTGARFRAARRKTDEANVATILILFAMLLLAIGVRLFQPKDAAAGREGNESLDWPGLGASRPARLREMKQNLPVPRRHRGRRMR
jgi:hypothetical protein